MDFKIQQLLVSLLYFAFLLCQIYRLTVMHIAFLYFYVTVFHKQPPSFILLSLDICQNLATCTFFLICQVVIDNNHFIYNMWVMLNIKWPITMIAIGNNRSELQYYNYALLWCDMLHILFVIFLHCNKVKSRIQCTQW